MNTKERLCVWCGGALGAKPGDAGKRGVLTGVVCAPCKENFSLRSGRSLRGFLDRLGVPVVLMGADREVLDANTDARSLLGRDLPSVAGKRWGEMMECAHARIAGGCGQSVHCRSCAIRNAVRETGETGRSLFNVRAYLDTEVEAEKKTVCLLVSTEKAGSLVLLRVDDLRDKPRPR